MADRSGPARDGTALSGGSDRRRRSFWGWGWEDAAVDPGGIAPGVESLTGITPRSPAPAPDLRHIRMPASRIDVPDTLREICSTDPRERASHTYGKSFRDIVRGLAGEFDPAPDAVARPEREAEIEAVLDWCAGEGYACIPYGGGSSVVGGVESDVPDTYRGAVSLDLTRLSRLLDLDLTSRAARFQAGVLGPDLEASLRPHGLTLRHFPQSFEFSSLGGWIATRSGGHYATLHTHIDDFVESLRVVTPRGVSESRRLPGSGAGPSPDRLFIGSEGILGVVTEAWVRLQDRPTFKASASATFATLEGAVPAVRALSQGNLYPTNCRALDPGEAVLSGVGSGEGAVLLLGFESADHDVAAAMDEAIACVRDHGGEVGAPTVIRPDPEATGERSGDDRAEAWRAGFLAAPYLRDALARLGLIVETFETSITWDRFQDFHEAVRGATETALREVCGGGRVQCRFTHTYPDGVAPYYTVLAPGAEDLEGRLSQWAEIKAAASQAILAAGGTITHHHAVGRDHRAWYDRQRPDAFAAALSAAKGALDPAGVLNPGVLVDVPGT